MKPTKHVSILLVIVVAGLAGCSSPGAGGTSGPNDPASTSVTPVTLSLGTGDSRGRPDTAVVEHFAEQVEQLSDGAMTIEITWQAAGESGSKDSFEQGIVGMVQGGELDLGWIAARAWDTVDVSSFQALQAPFLITDQALLGDVVSSPIADDMLSSLDEVGLVGFGLYPDQLRHPVGYASPLRSVEDFDGAQIRLVPSNATEALVRAFGGTPVYGVNGDALDAAIRNGELDGTETSLGFAPDGSILTANVVLFPRVNTLFASAEGLSSLSDAQRAILEEAAGATVEFSIAAAEREDAGAFCAAGGQLVEASEADIASLMEAAQPVWDTLRADPQTAAFIDQIRALRDGSTAPAGPTTSCEQS